MNDSTFNRSCSPEEQLEVLNALFLERVVKEIDELSQTFKDRDNRHSQAGLKSIFQRLHNLSGAGGTFGFSALSNDAKEMEQTVKHWLHRQFPPSLDEWTDLEAAASELTQTLKK